MPEVSVVVPVGPYPGNKKWLPEALDSCWTQSLQPSQVLLIDDGANLEPDIWHADIWKTPWRSGVAHAFNFGVALAKSDLVFMLGSDDYLHHRCLEQCVKAWERNDRKDAYYWVGVEYLDDREHKLQFAPCNAAMVTKGLWKWSGGFPPESSVGAPDAALISCLWGSDKLQCVHHTQPLYYYRSHPETDTSRRGPWQGVILQTRDILTSEFKETTHV